jgi:type I restriction enzyme M protein
MNDTNLSSFIWSVADLLHGDYKQSDYGNVTGQINVFLH